MRLTPFLQRIEANAVPLQTTRGRNCSRGNLFCFQAVEHKSALRLNIRALPGRSAAYSLSHGRDVLGSLNGNCVATVVIAAWAGDLDDARAEKVFDGGELVDVTAG